MRTDMNEEVRESTIAGTWYPGRPDELKRTIESYYKDVKKQNIQGKILGLISPHAGYIYSGVVAAHGYKQLIGKKIELVCILSPLHRIPLGRYVVHSASFYRTPLGKIRVDKSLIEKLKREIQLQEVSWDAEHSLEIQLPFLQMALGDFELLPIMVGHGDIYEVDDIVEGLATLLSGKNCLIVASSDLHHIPDYEEVIKKDREVVKVLKKFVLDDIREVLSKPDTSVCGRVPICIAVDLAMRLGANQFQVFCQSNSGDITGEKDKGQYTVGYLSAGMIGR